MSRSNRPPLKDMYWFAHGGAEADKSIPPKFDGEEEPHSSSPTWNALLDQRDSPDDHRLTPTFSIPDGASSSGPASLERDDKLRISDRQIAAEERRKQIREAEQEKHDAVMRKHVEREAALEARRNAQRSTISFAFGSLVARPVETSPISPMNETGDCDIMSQSFTAGLTDKREDLMSRSMHAAIPSAPRGRRKNDLTPTVPYDRHTASKTATSSSTRKRSVSMTRLDQLAQPRRYYVEATKAATSGAVKDLRSPNRPLSSASEHSGGSANAVSSVTRRVRTSPKKPRPVSVAGTFPDRKQMSTKHTELKASPTKRSYSPNKRVTETPKTHKTPTSAVKKSIEKVKATPRPATAVKPSTPKPTPSTPKPTPSRPTSTSRPTTSRTPRKSEEKQQSPKPANTPGHPTTPKAKDKRSTPSRKEIQKVAETLVAAVPKRKPEANEIEMPNEEMDTSESEQTNGKRIISAEEARAALAEKRRLAREQAEKEAEMERQRQEELKREEEERLRLEEEEQRRMEEEHLRLIEEHRRQEEEKLRKAIEDQEKKEEEEKAKRDEELRMKTEQDQKAKEEAERQRLELEEKLRKEEEERAERKKRLEKIMSRTRGKSNGTSPSGSLSGSEIFDIVDNPQDNLSSGGNSLDSNEMGEQVSEDPPTKAEMGSANNSSEAHPMFDVNSDNASLNSNDLMMPLSETASQESSLVMHNKESLVAAQVESDGQLVDDGFKDQPSTVMTNKVDADFGDPFANDKQSFVSDVIEKIESSSNAVDVQPPVHEELDVAIAFQDLSVESPKAVEMQQPLMSASMMESVYFQETADSNMRSEETHDRGEPSSMMYFNNFADEESRSDHRSGDIKLPDPIYETSDDGSVSSERHHQDFKSFAYQFEQSDHQQNSPVFKDSFPEELVQTSSETEAFRRNENPFSFENSENDQLSDAFNLSKQQEIQQSMMGSSINAIDGDFEIPQSQEMEKGNTSSVRSSTSSVVEADIEYANKDFNPFDFKDNGPVAGEEHSSNSEILQAYNLDSNTGHLTSESVVGDISQKSTNNWMDANAIGDGPYIDNPFSSDIQQGSEFEQRLFARMDSGDDAGKQNAFDKDMLSTSSDNVTVIKSNDNGACIGIISSFEHDQAANDFPKPFLHNELSKNNFEFASVTDSEDNSSLDSNLSQVMTVENEENPAGLNHTNNSVLNGKSHVIETESVLNHNSFSTMVNGFNGSSVISNGHNLESSRDFSAELSPVNDGKNISSVDQNNIFENVDAMDFGKVSPDPFLAKGSSKQMSGNPFLM